MNAVWLAALFFAAYVALPRTQAQDAKNLFSDEALLKSFLEMETKAENGGPNDQYAVALGYYYGKPYLPKNRIKAAEWFLKAAEKGHVDSQLYLGRIYSGGEGVPVDHAEALKWFRKAAEQNDADSQCFLGHYYQSGRGVERDYGESVKWFRKAAEQNLPQAQFQLAACYAEGRGVVKDLVEAYAWWNLAAIKAGIDGEGDLAAKMRDSLEGTLSPQQVAEAQKRSKELRAMIEARAKR